jgi:hypothetical protein
MPGWKSDQIRFPHPFYPLHPGSISLLLPSPEKPFSQDEGDEGDKKESRRI